MCRFSLDFDSIIACVWFKSFIGPCLLYFVLVDGTFVGEVFPEMRVRIR